MCNRAIKLEKENRELRKKIKQLLEELKRKNKEFEELKAKHAITVSNLQTALKIKPNNKNRANPIGPLKGMMVIQGVYQRGLIRLNL